MNRNSSKSKITMGSLFDGSGSFPLVAAMCDIEPIWASEIEPYPILVSHTHFPKMEHLGNIKNINGKDIEPVDVITFGSPCQDLSVAGEQQGIKHESLGDCIESESGLFIEAIRIIREMREATHGRYPKIILWENVAGALNSNGGADFQVVLQEIESIVAEDDVYVPRSSEAWSGAGSILGDKYSISWRILDAQFWGVPQRRRRIYLVGDFTGRGSEEILFNREGLSRHFKQSKTEGNVNSKYVREGSQGADRQADLDVLAIEKNARDARFQLDSTGKSGTLLATTGGGNQPMVGIPINNGDSGRFLIADDDKWSTLCSHPGADTRPMVAVKSEDSSLVACIEGRVSRENDTSGGHGLGIREDVAYTLTTQDRHAVAFRKENDYSYYNKVFYKNGMVQAKNANTLLAIGGARKPDTTIVVNNDSYEIRRLTPLECSRLQGLPDYWEQDIDIQDPTEEDLIFWRKVFNEYGQSKGQKKQKTDQQIKRWLADPYSDSASYKMIGNGIAIPTALYVMEGIAAQLRDE